jgi:hypothetical protein
LAAIGSTKVVAAIVAGALAVGGGGFGVYRYQQHKAAEQAAIVRQQEEAAEAARLAEEAEAAAEAARIAAAEEQARIAAEQAEAERIAAEKAEAERLAAEEAALLEAERLAAEAEAARIAEEEAAAAQVQQEAEGQAAAVQPEATPEPPAQEQPSGAGMIMPGWTSPLAGQLEPAEGPSDSEGWSNIRWNQTAGAWEATGLLGGDVWILPDGHVVMK